MPTDELSPLDTEQVNRILVLALNTKKLKQNALDTTSLLSEVNIDYARTMNKIIFDLNLTRPALAHVSSALRVLESKEEALAKLREKPCRIMPVPRHDFPKHFSDFCFNSFYTKGEAIKALVDVNEQCLKLTELSLFNTRISKVCAFGSVYSFLFSIDFLAISCLFLNDTQSQTLSDFESGQAGALQESAGLHQDQVASSPAKGHLGQLERHQQGLAQSTRAQP